MRPAKRRRRPRLARLAPWTVLILGVGARIATHEVPTRTPDEVFYSRYALAVAEDGLAYFPRFTRQVNEQPKPGDLFSWPERSGYIVALASALKISGQNKVEIGAYLSLAASAIAMALVLALGTALSGPWTASAAVLLIAVSPLDLAVARRTWQDSLLALLALAMVYACVRFCAEPRRWRWPALFFSAGAFALLVKESAWPVYAAGTLALAWAARTPASGHTGGRAIRPVAILAWGAMGVAIASAAIVAACGGPAEALRTWNTSEVVNAPNEYMRLFQTGSALYYFAGLGLLQPVAFTLGLIGAVVAVARPSWLADRVSPGPRVLGWFAIGFFALAAAYPQKNLRFTAPLTAPLALLAALALRSSVEWLAARLPTARRWIPIVTGLLIALSAVLDFARFREYFDRRGLTDPVTPMLMRPPEGP